MAHFNQKQLQLPAFKQWAIIDQNFLQTLP